jgi:hypothetical protein
MRDGLVPKACAMCERVFTEDDVENIAAGYRKCYGIEDSVPVAEEVFTLRIVRGDTGELVGSVELHSDNLTARDVRSIVGELEVMKTLLANTIIQLQGGTDGSTQTKTDD